MSTPPILSLYRVTLQGFNGWTTGVSSKVSYVVATDSTAAYQQVRALLETKDYGYPRDRELDKVELVASASFYTDAPARLFLPAATLIAPL